MARRLFIFALRDQLPLDEDGWNVYVHPSQCPKREHPFPCAATTATFIQRPVVDAAWDRANVELLSVLDGVVGGASRARARKRAPSLQDVDAMLSLVVASTPATGDRNEEFESAFMLISRAVDALRIATQAPISPLTIERVWPLYFVVNEDESGVRKVASPIIIEHGIRAPTRASGASIKQAEQFLAAGFNGDPVESVRYWLLGAQNDARVHGDYSGAILKTAAAAEVLIKATAAMLMWECQEHGTGSAPKWASASPGVLGMKPSKIVGTVLSPGLQGSWSSQHAAQPIGGWRIRVARVRNRIIHQGYRPTSDEVEAAIVAVDALVGHIGDRLAANVDEFPRTAILLLGRAGLERRNAWGRVQETHMVDSAKWSAQYRAWVRADSDEVDDD